MIITKSVTDIQKKLETYATEEKKEILPRFFKTGKGEYGEGDKFLGVVVPNIRKVAKRNVDVNDITLNGLLTSCWHEMRMCGLLILCTRFEKADEKTRSYIYHYYLSHTAAINNWDLVDLSAPCIMGRYLLDKKEERKELYNLATSNILWEQRIAVVSTLTFIRKDDFNDILHLAELLLHHPHDLMQKAIGWMLREVGKKDKNILKNFLELHSTEMPRTMLRYAIEKLEEKERLYYLKKK